VRRLAWTGDPAETVAALRSFAPPAADVKAAVSAILVDVRAHGDSAVRTLTRRLDGVTLPAAYGVPAARLAERLQATPPALRTALEVAAANIRAYHEREAAQPWRATLAQGQVVGQEVVPMAAAGL
jgi:histidinol dehydrogenase